MRICYFAFFTVIASLSLTARASVELQATSFEALPGFTEANLEPSLSALKESCRIIVQKSTKIPTGTTLIPLTQASWLPLCEAALKTQSSKDKAKTFFLTWFTPYQITNDGKNTGLFTGYYLPTIAADTRYSPTYSVPIYSKPRDLVTAKLEWFDPALQGKRISGKITDGQLYPYNVTREQIDEGALNGKADVVLWCKSKIDRFFLQIQGSGIAKLPTGEEVTLGYNGDNGQKYYPIGHWLVDQGFLTKENVSLQSIHDWLTAHPKEADALMNRNPSFVFFKKLPSSAVVGTETAPLTAGYSLAVDNQIIPFGLPLWLTTTIPDSKNPNNMVQFDRLVVAQDTGGAIKGAIRGDIFFGAGAEAKTQAGNMKNQGSYWLLVPKTITL